MFPLRCERIPQTPTTSLLLLSQIVLQNLICCEYTVPLSLPYLCEQCVVISSTWLSAASSCYRWTGRDSDHEVAPPLPFIIPSWRLRSGLTLALPLPFLFLSLYIAFLIRLGHPIQSHETGDHGLSVKCCHLFSLHHLSRNMVCL